MLDEKRTGDTRGCDDALEASARYLEDDAALASEGRAGLAWAESQLLSSPIARQQTPPTAAAVNAEASPALEQDVSHPVASPNPPLFWRGARGTSARLPLGPLKLMLEMTPMAAVVLVGGSVMERKRAWVVVARAARGGCG